MASRSFKDQKPKKPHVTRKGQGGVPGEVWDLREDIIAAFENLEDEVDELVTILDHSTVLIQGRVKLNFTGSGVVLAIDPIDNRKVNIAVSGGGGGSGGNTTVSSLDTTAMTEGLFGYVLSNSLVRPADAGMYASAIALGCFDGVPGSIVVEGVLNVKFSDLSPMPQPGQRIFLAHASEEPLGGAAGKVTTAAPVTGFVAEVGEVMSVNAVTFSSTRIAPCLVRVQQVMKRS